MLRLIDTNEEIVEPPRKRKRPMISCTECHQRKQKCDRQQPCSRCIKREIPEKCSYEVPDTQQVVVDEGSPPHVATVSTAGSLSAASSSFLGVIPTLPENTSEALVSQHLGYSSSTTGTLGIIQTIGVVTDQFAAVDLGAWPSSEAVLQYRTLIRQLPPQRHIETLVAFFYRELSWQYEIVDEGVFRQQLSSWDQVPYASRNQPFHLPAELRQFPAILFQLLGQALLFQPRSYDSSLDDLRHAPDMDLADVAAEFSDAGRQLSALFGSSEVTMTKVQAGLLRACFEKTTGAVANAWHTLGQTIRDAQEIGLHRLAEADEFTCPSKQLPETRVGRKLWLILHLWDGHMGVVLDRPMATQLDSKSAPTADSDSSDEPTSGDIMEITPFNMILCGYHAAYKYLQDIHQLSSVVQDASDKIDAIHSEITSNLRSIPPWAQLQAPNYDDRYPWLPAAREVLQTEAYFTLLALHRPFIFLRPKSRTYAFAAATRILESQSRLFGFMEPRHYPAFNLVFATFDAAVIVAVTHILFPDESEDQVQASLKRLQWALERFYAMRSRNKLAGTAYSVVKAMYGKVLNRRSGTLDPVQPHETTKPTSIGYSQQHGFSAEMSPDAAEQLLSVSQSLDNILPPRPLRDLVFQDYTTGLLPAGFAATSAEDLAAQPILDDEFWQIINSFVHGKYTTEKVKYPSHGETVAGVLYKPSNVQNPPGVVIIGPYSFTKEQAPTQYATRLADEGYAALVFDPRTVGESTGEPRRQENPVMKNEDAVAGLDYLVKRGDVNKDALFLVGVCQGGPQALPLSLATSATTKPMST
ncbi:hypothetical protein NLG97_g4034 [Lecanicillium saksenae]|uniref:Uncharacterized protein n=1 Tax=Lecanicillium saksenae TaxID=468837 RepID=A0ACC1QWF7_9HYPO|nr:hypothetical protein NLG97_g4034 [Lecanicillium saksenae]